MLVNIEIKKMDSHPKKESAIMLGILKMHGETEDNTYHLYIFQDTQLSFLVS